MTTETLNPVIAPSAAESIGKILGDFDFDTVVKEITEGKFSPDSPDIINRVISFFMGELKTAFALIGSIAVLIIISAFINNLNHSFRKNAVSEATGMAIFIYMSAIAATAFRSISQYVIQTLSDITMFVHGIIPSMATLCMSGGEYLTATMAHPVIFFICSCAAMLIKNVITPLVLLRAVCILLCGITGNDSLSEFSELFAKLHKTILSFSMSIFAGILGVSSFASASFDSLAARGVKFAISSSVPVVGGSLSEAMSSVAESAMLLKNAVGLGGVLALFAMFAVPLLKIRALSLGFRITAAFTAPVSEKRVTEILRKLGDCIDMLFSSIACIATIIIIAIAAIL